MTNANQTCNGAGRCLETRQDGYNVDGGLAAQ